MDIQKLNEIFSEEFNIDCVIAIKQNRVDKTHSWLDEGRRANGFTLITDCPVCFTLADGRKINADVGDIVFMSKGSRYTIYFDIPDGHISHPLMVNFRLTDLKGEEILLPSGVTKLLKDDGNLLPLFLKITQLYKNSSTVLLKAKTLELIGNLFPLELSDECCIGYINRHYTHNFSIPALAEKCSMSETAYRKRFKEITGLSPIAYINKLKIEKACSLLLDGELSATDISEFLNFDSISYFYRVFKSITGTTPKNFKEKADRAP